MISNKTKLIQNIKEAERLTVLLTEVCHELKSDIVCEKVSEPPFRIADGEKGTVAQLLWLLAKVLPVTDKNGNYITNTEAAAKEMGIALFGESFPNWPQTLHAAFNRKKGFDFEKKIQKAIDEKKDSMR